jgi:thiamine pyrophosphate-dependent acetolactate synthase large subunit-like protein
MSSEQRDLQSILEQVSHDLKTAGVQYMFGIAGDPITPLITFSEERGIKYFGFRNEQSASYAASAVSFLTRRKSTGVCLTVAGPGMTNALTGLAHANVNRWPVVLVCPFTSSHSDFQGIEQIEAARGLAKDAIIYSGTASVLRAFNLANTPPFGSVVLLIPRTPTHARISHSFTRPIGTRSEPSVPNPRAPCKAILIIGSISPLYPELDERLLRFVEERRIPFLAEPLSRGILEESHELCVTAARSFAFKNADLAILVGGRLDWMLSYGKSPKWNPECTFVIYTDVNEEIPVGLESRTTIRSLSDFPLDGNVTIDAQWREQVLKASKSNKQALKERLRWSPNSRQEPSHFEAVGAIREAIHKSGLEEALVISEGANTMDVARVALDVITGPSMRLDAGRWGTMGGGLGYVIAASACRPEEPIICIEGDSALGFSGMELETIVRYKCKALIFVFNNGGIYTGTASNATSFTPGVRHDVLMAAVGGIGLTTKGGNAQVVYETAINAFYRVSNGEFPVLVDINIHPDSGNLSGSLSRL